MSDVVSYDDCYPQMRIPIVLMVSTRPEHYLKHPPIFNINPLVDGKRKKHKKIRLPVKPELGYEDYVLFGISFNLFHRKVFSKSCFC